MPLGSVAFAPMEWSPHPGLVAFAGLPRISVALCVYNGEAWLRPQLDSLLAQEGVELEVVVVDDCSTDGSLALLREYARRDARIRVHANQVNLGHLRSFEKCMSLCDAPMIAPCDQDDVWHPRKLATLARAIGKADMAYCDSAYIDGDGQPIGRNISDDLATMHDGRDPMKFVFQNTVSGHALLVRREVFDAARPFPHELYHDWWLAMRAAAGNGVVYVDEPLVQFRRHVSAYSPLGKKEVQSRRERKKQRKQQRADAQLEGKRWPGSPDRRWIEERMYLLDVFGQTGWRGSEDARLWRSALSPGLAGSASGLFRMIWRNRASLPPFRGIAWINALQFFRRTRRRMRRALLQDPLETRLFRG